MRRKARLRPSFRRPKPLYSYRQQTLDQHLVSHLSTSGFSDVVITLGYGDAIEGLGDGCSSGSTSPMSKNETRDGGERQERPGGISKNSFSSSAATVVDLNLSSSIMSTS